MTTTPYYTPTSQNNEYTYKKTLGVAYEYPGTAAGAENESSLPFIFNEQIMSSTVPSTAPTIVSIVSTFTPANGGTKYATTDPNIYYYEKLGLAINPDGTGYSYVYSSTQSSNLTTQAIPSTYDPSGSYAISVYNGSTLIPSNDPTNGWIFDTATGCLTFIVQTFPGFSTSSTSTYPTISFYRYEGELGINVNDISGNLYVSGNVGIGVQDPTNFLQILGNSSTLASNAPDNGSYHNIVLQSTKTGSTTYSMALGVDYTNGFGYINAEGNGVDQPVCLQTRGGNVGIGVGSTTPQCNLSVVNSDGNVSQEILSKDAYKSTLYLSEDTSPNRYGFEICYDGSDDTVNFSFDSGSIDGSSTHIYSVMTFAGNYAGIRNTSPQYTLDVSGTLNASGLSTLAGGLTNKYISVTDASSSIGDSTWYNATIELPGSYSIITLPTSYVNNGNATTSIYVWNNNGTSIATINSYSYGTSNPAETFWGYNIDGESTYTLPSGAMIEFRSDGNKHWYALPYATQSSTFVQSYVMPYANGDNQGWYTIGTFYAPQSGYTLKIKMYLHCGFNASNNQDSVTEIFFKTSNGGATDGIDIYGFAGNSWYYSYGDNTWNTNPKWVSDPSGINATNFTLYLYLPSYYSGSHYEVSYYSLSTCLWSNKFASSSNPGTSSSTVCVASSLYNILSTYVGINNTSPAYTLDVSGTLNVTGTIYKNGTALNTALNFTYSSPTSANYLGFSTASSTISTLYYNTSLYYSNSILYSPSYDTTSDYRIKDNVEQLDDKFTVDNLRPVTYKNKITERQDIGFIAHEVQKEYPFLVTGEKDDENLQSLNYIGMIGLLVKEIQDLKKRIAVLENK